MDYTGVKVFSTTMAKQREALGDFITNWIRQNPQVEIVDKVVLQSSDAEYHCFTVVLFYSESDPQADQKPPT